MRLNFFPIPFLNELFFSLVCRFSRLSGELSVATVNRLLFGSKDVHLPIEFPVKLNHFQRSISDVLSYSIDDFVNNTSLFPFYSKFSENSQVDLLRSIILTSGYSNIKAALGLNSSKVKSLLAPKYCIECALEDFNRFDQFYFHREHQLPIHVCPKHLTRLNSYEIPLGRSRYTDYLFLDPSQINVNPKVSDNHLLNTMSRQASLILHNQSTFSLSYNYKEKLSQLGFYRGKNINANKLIDQIKKFYGEKELNELISLNVGKMSPYQYILSPINRGNSILNPIRHILLFDFVENNSGQQIFPVKEKGSWICYNKAAEHYLKDVVTNFSQNYDHKHKQTIEIYTCNCGMVYKKYLVSVANQESKKSKIKIIKYGDVWEQRLKECLDQNLTPYKISKLLGVDIRIIRRRIVDSPLSKKQNMDEKVRQYRKLWEDLLKEGHRKSEVGVITYARKKLPTVYKYLLKVDKIWLNVINIQYVKKAPNKQLRINWVDIDKSMLEKLKENFQQFIENGYRKRISETALLKSVSHIRNISNKKMMDRVPMSISYARQNAETKERYHLRKTKMIFEEMMQSGEPITYSSILAKGNLRRPNKILKNHVLDLVNRNNQ